MKLKIYSPILAILVAFPSFSQAPIKSAEAKAVIESRINGTYKKTDQTPAVYNEDFEKGKELFSLNEPAKAIPYFEKSLESENVDPAVYIYLGVAYYQTKDYNKSLAICVQGLAKDNTDHKILAYNAGNSCYAMGNYMRADASYAIAIREDSTYAPPVLNRANAQLKLDRLEDARNSYIKYLELDPETPQRAKIEELIRLLQQEIELRAKQKPEIINPDEFVENEKMEVADEPEKVDEILPVYVVEKDDQMEKVEFDSAAPALPVVRNEENNGEKISENLAVLANEKENQNQKLDDENAAEKVDANVPSLPVAKNDAGEKQNYEEKIQDNLVALVNQNQNEKVEEEKSEKIKDAPPVLPVEKNEKVNEKPDETLVHIDSLEPVKDENEKVDAEKINPATLATDDYQKNEEEAKKAAREKAEKEAAIEKEKAEKEAELEREKKAAEERERAEAVRKAAEEKAEAERKAAEEKAEAEKQAAEEREKAEQAAMIKMDEDDPYLNPENPAEVPDDVKVKENDDGTVDIKIPTLSFKINSAELTENKSNTETVQKVYDILSDKKYSDLDVTITGYVNPDNDEWTEDENKLALARAESVKKRLVKMGIDASRIKAQHGNGKTANKEYNRRVEFLLSKD